MQLICRSGTNAPKRRKRAGELPVGVNQLRRHITQGREEVKGFHNLRELADLRCRRLWRRKHEPACGHHRGDISIA
ncbi:hypothetical protein D9M72_584910 [compost metagenome]